MLVSIELTVRSAPVVISATWKVAPCMSTPIDPRDTLAFALGVAPPGRKAALVKIVDGTVLIPPTITVPTRQRLVLNPATDAPLVASILPPSRVTLHKNAIVLVPP